MKNNASDQPATRKGLRVQRLVRLNLWTGIAIPLTCGYVVMFWLTPWNYAGVKGVILTHGGVFLWLWCAYAAARLLHRA
ncbi:MAG: hypothetical protein ACOVN2_08720 [Usitatibacteraceae bacterium]